MTERLLQFIWQFRYFNQQGLYTETGERLHIISPGEINTHQGPDFLHAEIRIGDTVWVGNIELHLLASGWERHGHGEDIHYKNVVLHVVWDDDRPSGKGKDKNEAVEAVEAAGPGRNVAGVVGGASGGNGGRNIPVLVLQHRVPKLLLGRYAEWMKSRGFVACERQLSRAGEAVWSGWKQCLLEERLLRKTAYIRDCLQQNRQHWEETAWWLMARNFGLPVNKEAFDSIARSLPFAILSRHRHYPEQLEALLLGQAGLLEGDHGEDGYLLGLQKEFRHLRNKYRLQPIHEPLLMLRMRPGNFPAVRLAQLAGLVHRSFPWFGRIREAGSLPELRALLDTGTSSYWDHHYVPGKASVFKRKNVGSQMQGHILINTCLPLLFAYGSLRKEDHCREKALRWLSEAGAERNTLTGGWATLGVAVRNAADSQALLELKTCWCDRKKCLECAVGKALLGAKTEQGADA